MTELPLDVAPGAAPSDRPWARQTYAVWEITLKCNLGCNHCGSRAGDARTDELSTEEALDLVHQMADVGIGEITLIGGEAFLRPDWLTIAEEITRCGMRVGMTTGGYGINRTTAERMTAAGFTQVSVSVDGIGVTHDELRGRVGSFHFAFETMKHLTAAGIQFGCNTQINRLSARELPMIYERIRDAGAIAWQLQMTVPMGNAADNWNILLQPYELLDVHPVLGYLAQRGLAEGVQMQTGNNIGYYGPYERFLRSRGSGNEWAFWSGCQAGLRVLGIEADGKIKGCPSLPTAAYTGGNIRDRSLRDIVENTEELTFNLEAGTPRAADHLWGFCGTCQFGHVCRGGCSWTSHVFFDRRGNNPYCHHRSLVHAARGLREEVRLARPADGLPFDNGEFGIQVNDLRAPFAGPDPLQFHLGKVQWPDDWLEAEPALVHALAEERNQTIQAYAPEEAAAPSEDIDAGTGLSVESPD